MKASDDTCIPQSRPCHDVWERSGHLAKAQKRAWADEQMAATRAQLVHRDVKPDNMPQGEP